MGMPFHLTTGSPSRSRRAALALLPALALLVALLPAATAQAAPAAPVLIRTAPESPGLSTTPKVIGRSDGVGTSVVHRAFGPVASTTGPTSTIALYTDAACAGPVVASGPLSELEGEGIAVSVAPGSTTAFFATQTDPDEPGVPSPCSAPGLVYRHVTGPPATPVLSAVSPASPADDNAPLLTGSAEAGATVSIYADAACSGTPLGSGTAAAFGSTGVQAIVPDNSTTAFHALASWAGLSSACSSTSVTYQEVTAPPGEPEAPQPQPPVVSPPVVVDPPGRPPAPKLHTEPGGRAHDTMPRVLGSVSGSVRVDLFRSEGCDGARAASATPAEFAAGVPLRVDANSTTSFSAIAVDASGERSRCSPEPAVYSEDSLPPLTRITFGPGVKTRKRAPIFRFADVTGDPPGTTFLCKLDRRPWQACQTPWRLSRLRPRSHVVQVRAIDAAGNQEIGAAKRRFKVIGPAPR
jgi:hypothetical protein